MRVMMSVPHARNDGGSSYAYLDGPGADRKKNDRRMGTTVVNDNYLFELGG